MRKFQEKHSDDIRVITIHPLNYCISKNEDIFEYIKRDILLQLKDDGIYENIDFDAFSKSLFSRQNLLEVISFITSALPHGALIDKLIKKVSEIQADYENERKDTVEEYIEKFSKIRGSIYEQDGFTILIESLIDRIKKAGKRCILLIEDLDRIDPNHIFRILNILGAHIDETDNNKFKFDNIVVVLDYDITKHIFHHFYGSEANYSGYMSKFVSHYPYRYSINQVAQEYLFEVIENECGLTRTNIESFCISNFPEDIKLSSIIRKKSVRDIVKVLDNLNEQYETCVYNIRDKFTIKTDAPIVKFLSILKRLQCDINDSALIRSPRLIKGTEGLSLFGDFMIKNPHFVNGCYFKMNGDGYSPQISNNGSLYSCEFRLCLGGLEMKSDLDHVMNDALIEAKKFVHDI